MMEEEVRDIGGKVYIVGIGPGSRKYILSQAVEVMEECHMVIGFKRAVESLDFVKKEKLVLESLTQTLNFINENRHKNIAIAASGDPCFYGISDYISRNFKGNLEIIPGISSFQYLFAKLKKSWQGAFLGSLHGREAEFVDIVKRERVSFWLTDKKNTPSLIAKKLLEEGVKAIMHIGENLSYEDERICTVKLEAATSMEFSELSVIIIERE
jgi:cobalt-precorrin-7 (C5)-methyltransferase